MKRFKRFSGLCPQNDSVVKTTSKQQTVTNHSTFQLFNHSTGKAAFTLAEDATHVYNKSPLLERGFKIKKLTFPSPTAFFSRRGSHCRR